MLLPNGSMIKNDVIEAFNKSVQNTDNQHEGGGINWDAVDQDLHISLGPLYSLDYLYECLDVLVDNYYV